MCCCPRCERDAHGLEAGSTQESSSLMTEPMAGQQSSRRGVSRGGGAAAHAPLQSLREKLVIVLPL